MPSLPLVSAIIPAYNAGRYLADAIESVLAQTYRDFELIVVDDGSTDDTALVAGRYGPPVRVVSKHHYGLAATRNAGAAAARGQYLCYLDADDLWPAGKLALQLAAFEQQRDLGAVFGLVQEAVIDDLQPKDRRIALREGLHAGQTAGSMMVRREVFEQVGHFNTAWRVGEFIDWFQRARDAGVEMITIPHVLLIRRLHDANLGITRREDRIDFVRVLRASIHRRRERTSTAAELGIGDEQPELES